MQKLYSNILGTPVFDQDGGRPITTVRDLVVDPESGKLIAFVVNQSKNLIITPVDILFWKEILKVRDRDAIISASEVLRVESVQKNGIHFFHNKVETKSGKFLGKVVDFEIDTNLYVLARIHVAKGFLGLIKYDSRIIPADHIVEVLEDKIVVKDDFQEVKQETEEKAAIKDLAVG